MSPRVESPRRVTAGPAAATPSGQPGSAVYRGEMVWPADGVMEVSVVIERSSTIGSG